MPVRQTIATGQVPVKVFTDQVEASARAQLENVSRLPIVFHHVAAMPDVHGCGMSAVRLSLRADQLPDSLSKIRSAIERAVPVGFGEHGDADALVDAASPLERRLGRILERHPGIVRKQRDGRTKWIRQLGSLGGGNHFIEICVDQSDRVWVMLHSGSRGIGNAIGTYFIAAAREEMAGLDAHLPDRDLAYVREGSKLFDDYVEAVGWAQDYARANRREMMRLVLDALAARLPPFATTEEAINCHHNYVERERHFGESVWVTRKGAIRARQGELGIIPGSMGARSYIVRGRGNPESFSSCAHGAGRRMSRNEAKKRYTRADLEAQTHGVECRKDSGVIDEIPGAYKDIDQVMADQTDLVEVVHTLKQVVCVKG